MTFAIVVADIGLALRFWSELPVMRPVHRALVLWPAKQLNRLDRRHLILGLLFALVLIAGGEWLAMMGPLDVSVVLLWDVASFIDAAIALSLVSGSRVVQQALRHLPMMLRRRTRRHPRATQNKATLRTANDDDDGGSVAQAA